MKINVQKILFTLFGLFILAFIGVTVFNYFYSPYETEMVRQATVDDSIDVTAVALRNEKVITSTKSGIAVYAVQNGSKVAKDADVISYYSDNESASLKKQIDLLTAKISTLTDISTQNSNYAADLDLVSGKVTSDLFTLLNSIDEDDFSKADDYNNQLYYSLCQSGVTTGRIKNLSNKINELKTELSNLKSKYNKSSDTVSSKYSGYFFNEVDGFENAVDFDKITDLTVADYKKIKPKTVDENAVGKVVCDTSWYLVAQITANQAHELVEGESIKVALPLVNAARIDATVVALNRDSATGKVICVLGCTNMNSELCGLRQQKIQIIIKSHTGLRVNKKAVRIKDGKKGVYVMLGSIVKFRVTDIVYSGDEFVIVDSDNNDGQLKIYDDVIIKGKGLD